MLHVRAGKSDRPYMPAPLVFRPTILFIVAPALTGKQVDSQLQRESNALSLPPAISSTYLPVTQSCTPEVPHSLRRLFILIFARCRSDQMHASYARSHSA